MADDALDEYAACLAMARQRPVVDSPSAPGPWVVQLADVLFETAEAASRGGVNIFEGDG
jgi:hypothetical protein